MATSTLESRLFDEEVGNYSRSQILTSKAKMMKRPRESDCMVRQTTDRGQRRTEPDVNELQILD